MSKIGSFSKAWILSLTLMVQNTSSPQFIGTAVMKLSSEDVAAILSLEGVTTPWLIHASQGQIGRPVQIFLPPGVATGKLRRGKMLFALGTGPGQWHIVEAGQYAQVAVEGHSLEKLRDHLDLTSPFAVSGDISDDDLLSIVQLIRSKPLAALSNTIGQPAIVAGDLRSVRYPFQLMEPFGSSFHSKMCGGNASYSKEGERHGLPRRR